jgi:hypothetical protein
MPSARRLVRVAVLGGISAAALTGCDNSAPLGSGSRLAVDVDASSQPAQSTDDDSSSADSPFAPVDGAYGILPDGYAPLALCAQCACAVGTYCYGGSPYMTFSACDQTASTSLAIGCHKIPAGCANEPDCVCLLQALAPQMSCYPVCTDNVMGGFTVYCPP